MFDFYIEIIELLLLGFLWLKTRIKKPIPQVIEASVDIKEDGCMMRTMTYPCGTVREFHTAHACSKFSGEDLPSKEHKFHKQAPLTVVDSIHIV